MIQSVIEYDSGCIFMKVLIRYGVAEVPLELINSENIEFIGNHVAVMVDDQAYNTIGYLRNIDGKYVDCQEDHMYPDMVEYINAAKEHLNKLLGSY